MSETDAGQESMTGSAWETPDLFLDHARPLFDWRALAPWIGAVEARLGMPVSVALFKMTLLERWYQLSGPELDDACHGRAAFRRFLAAPLHGPVAEVWMYRQFKPKLAAAEAEIGRFISRAEAMLAERGLSPPSSAWTGADTAAVTQPNDEHVRTAVFEPGRLRAIAAEAEWIAQAGRAASSAAEAQALPGAASTKAAAILLWPWGASTAVDRVLRIGRDPEFSPFARQLWADARISRRHAELEPQAGSVLLRDLGASNGTYVADKPLPYAGSVLLGADATLQFGTNLAVKLVFYPREPFTAA
jgi:hypothetical protein